MVQLQSNLSLTPLCFLIRIRVSQPGRKLLYASFPALVRPTYDISVQVRPSDGYFYLLHWIGKITLSYCI